MHTITAPKMLALHRAMQAATLRRFAAHLAQHFPHRCAALGELGVADAMAYGVRRAAAHAILTEREVCRYLNLMFTFGRDFDVAEPWAAAVLAAPRAGAAHAVLDALMVQAGGHLFHAGGIVAVARCHG